MKVMIDLTSLADNFSGIERFAMSVTRELIKEKADRYLLVFKNEVHQEFRADEPNVEKIVLQGKNKLLFYQITLPSALCRIRADCYLFPAFPAPFFFFRKHGISVIHDMGCWDCPGMNKSYMELYFKILYRKAAHKKMIVTVSEFSKKRIADIFKISPEKVRVVPNSLSESIKNFQENEEMDMAVKEKYGLPDRYLLCLSTLEPRKNVRLLVEAYSELIGEKQLDCSLVLAGRKGWLIDELLSGIDSAVIQTIHFTGFVEEEHLPYVYKNADVFVFPSLYEGFGVPPIEAMAMGTVVISSDAASLPEVLKDAAVYFRSGSLDGLKTAILSVMNMEPDLKNDRKEKGVQLARGYTWVKSAQEMKAVLRGL